MHQLNCVLVSVSREGFGHTGYSAREKNTRPQFNLDSFFLFHRSIGLIYTTELRKEAQPGEWYSCEIDYDENLASASAHWSAKKIVQAEIECQIARTVNEHMTPSTTFIGSGIIIEMHQSCMLIWNDCLGLIVHFNDKLDLEKEYRLLQPVTFKASSMSESRHCAFHAKTLKPVKSVRFENISFAENVRVATFMNILYAVAENDDAILLLDVDGKGLLESQNSKIKEGDLINIIYYSIRTRYGELYISAFYCKEGEDSYVDDQINSLNESGRAVAQEDYGDFDSKPLKNELSQHNFALLWKKDYSKFWNPEEETSSSWLKKYIEFLISEVSRSYTKNGPAVEHKSAIAEVREDPTNRGGIINESIKKEEPTDKSEHINETEEIVQEEDRTLVKCEEKEESMVEEGEVLIEDESSIGDLDVSFEGVDSDSPSAKLNVSKPVAKNVEDITQSESTIDDLEITVDTIESLVDTADEYGSDLNASFSSFSIIEKNSNENPVSSGTLEITKAELREAERSQEMQQKFLYKEKAFERNEIEKDSNETANVLTSCFSQMSSEEIKNAFLRVMADRNEINTEIASNLFALSENRKHSEVSFDFSYHRTHNFSKESDKSFGQKESNKSYCDDVFDPRKIQQFGTSGNVTDINRTAHHSGILPQNKDDADPRILRLPEKFDKEHVVDYLKRVLAPGDGDMQKIIRSCLNKLVEEKFLVNLKSTHIGAYTVLCNLYGYPTRVCIYDLQNIGVKNIMSSGSAHIDRYTMEQYLMKCIYQSNKIRELVNKIYPNFYDILIQYDDHLINNLNMDMAA